MNQINLKKKQKAQIHTFKRNLSSTLVSYNQSDNVFLVDAQFKSYNASCNLIKDTFSIFTNRTAEFAATEQFFCEANKMNDAFTLNKDALLYDVSVGLRKINKNKLIYIWWLNDDLKKGILGMGFTQQSLPKQSFVDSLFAEKAFQKKTISFWLDKYEENNFIIYKEQKTTTFTSY